MRDATEFDETFTLAFGCSRTKQFAGVNGLADACAQNTILPSLVLEVLESFCSRAAVPVPNRAAVPVPNSADPPDMAACCSCASLLYGCLTPHNPAKSLTSTCTHIPGRRAVSGHRGLGWKG
eukprot:365126-Chlamydomonas_euryale.AAC.27